MQTPVTIRDTDVAVIEVLDLLARGHSHAQILEKYPKLNLGDILTVVRFAHDLVVQYVTSDEQIVLTHEIELRANNGRIVNVSKVREQYARAYESWKPDEEARLVELFQRGTKPEEIARILRRQPGAIMMRLRQKGLLKKSGRDSRG